MDIVSESKKLAIKLRADEESYVHGYKDLNETLDQTDQLWVETHNKADNYITANEILPDSDLMKLQTRLAKRSAKFYRPDSLVFSPTNFSKKLKQYHDSSIPAQTSSTEVDTTQTSSTEVDALLWLEIGNVAKKYLNTVPSFNFIHGTFDPDPVEVVKRKRKMKVKDQIGDLTRPVSMELSESTDKKDMMIEEANRVLTILQTLITKNKDNVICLFEFVTDPASFSRTVENIFILSILVKEGCVRVIKDRNKLPCLSIVEEAERNNSYSAETKQSIITITLEEWKDIVRTFEFEKPLIPPRKSIL